MAKHLLSKSTYIKSLQCQKALYLHKKRPFLRDKMSAVQLAKFRRGTAVGVLARNLYPGGIDMTPKSPSQYQSKRNETLLALQNPEITAIYEAVFQYDDVLIMLDILAREGDKWRAIEVKSSRGLSETYLQDAYLQYYVLNGNGIPLVDFELIYVNEDYILKDKLILDELFISQSVLVQAKEAFEKTASQIQKAKATLQLTKSPEVSIGTHCYKPYPCDFIGHCWKNVPQNSLLYLSSQPFLQRFDWFNNNIRLPEQLHNAELADQLMALNEQKLFVNHNLLMKNLKNFDMAKPTYLKFLFHQAAVPELRGMKPYEPIILAVSAFQPSNTVQQIHHWSCAVEISEWKNIFQFLNTLWKSSSVFIIHEDRIFDEFLKKTNEIHPEIKWINYAVLLSESDFMIPSISENPDQKLIQQHIFPNQKPLKDEAWLLKDLLDDPEKNSRKINFQLELYSKNLEEIHKYLISSNEI
ncbi:MAG: hypothetical protein PWQ54_31 [Bacteroidales bacterium]|nr:hypothetical protein [Bacteroidales bacterium]